MEEYLPLIIQLVSGAVGGNLAGSLMKNLSLGSLWNSVVGILGGGLGGVWRNFSIPYTKRGIFTVLG